MRLKWIAAVTVAAVLAGCSGGEPTASAPSPTETTASATPDVPKVSEKTICDLLFSGDENPLRDAADIVSEFSKEGDPSVIDATKAAEAEDSIRSLAERAPDSLAPHLVAEADVMKELQGVAESPVDGESVSFETFRSSGIEISNVCIPLL